MTCDTGLGTGMHPKRGAKESWPPPDPGDTWTVFSCSPGRTNPAHTLTFGNAYFTGWGESPGGRTNFCVESPGHCPPAWTTVC